MLPREDCLDKKDIVFPGKHITRRNILSSHTRLWKRPLLRRSDEKNLYPKLPEMMIGMFVKMLAPLFIGQTAEENMRFVSTIDTPLCYLFQISQSPFTFSSKIKTACYLIIFWCWGSFTKRPVII